MEHEACAMYNFLRICRLHTRSFECFSIVYDDVTKNRKIADDDVTMMVMVSSSPSKDSFYFHMDGVLFSFICKLV